MVIGHVDQAQADGDWGFDWAPMDWNDSYTFWTRAWGDGAWSLGMLTRRKLKGTGALTGHQWTGTTCTLFGPGHGAGGNGDWCKLQSQGNGDKSLG